MFWKGLGAIAVGSILAMAILLMVTDARPNTANRVAFAATSDPIIEQERRRLEIERLRKETELEMMEMSSEAQLRVEKAQRLQAQRLRNEISFANMLDFLRWGFVAATGGIIFIAAALWLLRLIASIDNIIYSFIFAPTRISAMHKARLVERENLPLLADIAQEPDPEQIPTTGRERGTRHSEHGNPRRNSPATTRQGGRTRMTSVVELPEFEVVEDESEATIQVGDFTLPRAEYLLLSRALDNGHETKSAIAKRLPGRYQTNLHKLNALIDHKNRYERTG